MKDYFNRQYTFVPEDVEAISDLLRNHAVFCGPANPSADWYAPQWYAARQATTGETFILLLDRNVYSLIARLADGDPQYGAEQDRLAAAIVYFVQYCDLQTESIVAILENASGSNDPRAVQEQAKFERVLSTDAAHLGDFSLRRAAALTVTGRSDGHASELMQLRRPEEYDAWLLNFGCALKLALLKLDTSYPDDVGRAMAFLEWCYTDYFFSSGATVYGMLALSPRRVRKMFKQLHGESVDNAIAGIRNATWDMTLLIEWNERSRAEHPIGNRYILCSFDRAVMKIAPNLMTEAPDEASRRDLLRQQFTANWGEVRGNRLLDTYTELAKNADGDQSRPANQRRSRNYWETKIAELGAVVRRAIAQ